MEFSLVLSNAADRLLEFRSTPSGLFPLKLMFKCSKSESLRDVSVTRIGDTLSYDFPQTVLQKSWTCCELDRYGDAENVLPQQVHIKSSTLTLHNSSFVEDKVLLHKLLRLG